MLNSRKTLMALVLATTLGGVAQADLLGAGAASRTAGGLAGGLSGTAHGPAGNGFGGGLGGGLSGGFTATCASTTS
jgi:hypothetical protein